MTSAQAFVVLAARSANGSVRVSRLRRGAVIRAEQGVTYTAHTETFQKPAKPVRIKRSGKHLIIEGDDGAFAQIENFYDLQNVGTCFDPQSGLEVVSAQSGAKVAVANTFEVWPLNQNPSASGVGPCVVADGAASSVPWFGVLLGGLALGGVAAGLAGGGSGGGGGAPDTVPPPVDLITVTDTNGVADGLTVRFDLPASGLVNGDKVTITIKDGLGNVVATVEHILTQAEIDARSFEETLNPDGGGVFGDDNYTITTVITDADGDTSDLTKGSGSFSIASGVLQDDYIANATVFIDLDRDGVLDVGEQSTTTDALGRFYFASVPSGAAIVALGGIDTTSGQANTSITYRAFIPTAENDAGAVDVVMSPLSTLIAAFVEQSLTSDPTVDLNALSEEERQTLVDGALKSAIETVVVGLGLPAEVLASASNPTQLEYSKFLTFDAAAAAQEQSDAGTLLLSANRQLNTVLASLGALVSGAAADSEAQLQASTSVVTGLANAIQEKVDQGQALSIVSTDGSASAAADDFLKVIDAVFEAATVSALLVGLHQLNGSWRMPTQRMGTSLLVKIFWARMMGCQAASSNSVPVRRPRRSASHFVLTALSKWTKTSRSLCRTHLRVQS